MTTDPFTRSHSPSPSNTVVFLSQKLQKQGDIGTSFKGTSQYIVFFYWHGVDQCLTGILCMLYVSDISLYFKIYLKSLLLGLYLSAYPVYC